MSKHPHTAAISALDREGALERATGAKFDVLVIGAGISGAGVANEASERGLKVAVLEANDFASGTSSRSSKLIHGGLRYLLTGDLGLVRKTARERKQIFHIAPHLAERRWMVIPAKTRARLMQLRAGVSTYEKLGQVSAEDKHQRWLRDDVAANEPLLNREVFPYACAYREYVTDDARLVLANLRASARRGATVLNQASVEGLLFDGEGNVCGVTARCALTSQTFEVNAKVVVNAAGPWVDALQSMEDPDARTNVQLAKGIHAVVPRSRLPLNHLVVYEASDGRHLFTVPRGDVVYIGTTDTSYEHGANLWPSITSEDIRYLLDNVSTYFNVEPIEESEIVGAWAGLRTLVAEPGKRVTEISRRDSITVGSGKMVSIAGGKLTGYRFVAREVVKQVASLMGFNYDPSAPNEVLPGGDFDGDLDVLAASLVGQFPVEQAVARRLAQLYGTEATKVLALGSAPLSTESKMVTGEVDWAVLEESANHVEDVIYRRSRVALYEGASRSLVEPVAQRMTQLLGWDARTKDAELRTVRNRLAADLAFGPEPVYLGATGHTAAVRG